MNFSQLELIGPLQKALEKSGFLITTPIQEAVIPHALKGKDILGSAQTGSGKTLAFVLPILQNLYKKRIIKAIPDGKINRKIEALILAPTRELAIQIGETFAPYATNANMKYTVIYGGMNQFHQVKAIERGVDILIATPGRLEDLISQGIIKLSYVEIFVLDEADKMLDMGFLPDVKKVIKRLPAHKQTLFFSATISAVIQELASSLLKSPEIISIKGTTVATSTINQKVYHINTSLKRKLLQQIVKRNDLKSIIVFVKTKDDTEYVLEHLKSTHITCDNIHRNRSQNARQRAINALKTGDIKVLVATDIASRGIDINNLSCVVNYHIPADPEVYVHRIGRTARAGKEGIAISLCSEDEKEDFLKIEKLLGEKVMIESDDSYKKEEIAKSIFGAKDGFNKHKMNHKKTKIKEKRKYYKKRG